LFNDRSNGWCLSHKFPLRNRDGEIIGLACLSQDIIEPSRDGLIDKTFADTVDFIRDHFAEGLRVEDLADRAGLSAAQFERRMKKIFQLSPGQFILKTRIDAAANLLLHGDDAIADVALHVGFCDQSALSRQFRQVTGLSPRQYRQMAGKKPL
jgi:AraC-like DNA-binding protein